MEYKTYLIFCCLRGLQTFYWPTQDVCNQRMVSNSSEALSCSDKYSMRYISLYRRLYDKTAQFQHVCKPGYG